MMRFCESFDHYDFNYFSGPNTADFLRKWTGGSNAAGLSGGSRWPTGRGLQIFDSGTIYKDIDNQATWIVGAAFKMTFSGVEILLFQLHDGATNQMMFRITSGGLIQVTRNATVLATGTTVVTPNVWHYAEFKVTINNTTGAYEARLDGVTQVSGSSVDTQNTANAYANRIHFGGPQVNAELDMDDIVIMDGTGSTNNDFIGDVRVEGLFPSGNGNSSQWVGSDSNSTDNYLLVDEDDPDGDSTYVQSSTVGNKDTYAYSNLTPATGTVYGVQIVPYARKTDASTRKIATIARLSTTEVDSSDFTLSSSYQMFPDVRETKPGGGAWTITDVNAAEFGEKVTV